LHNNFGKFYLSLTGFFSLAGGASAIRHLYLHSLPPDRIPSCGPDLNYLLDNNFVSDALIQLFIGDGNCAEVMWSLLGISIPGWVLICCSLIFLLSIRQFKAQF
jgi:disulfide bond formation protein DsbB